MTTPQQTTTNLDDQIQEARAAASKAVSRAKSAVEKRWDSAIKDQEAENAKAAANKANKERGARAIARKAAYEAVDAAANEMVLAAEKMAAAAAAAVKNTVPAAGTAWDSAVEQINKAKTEISNTEKARQTVTDNGRAVAWDAEIVAETTAWKAEQAAWDAWKATDLLSVTEDVKDIAFNTWEIVRGVPRAMMMTQRRPLTYKNTPANSANSTAGSGGTRKSRRRKSIKKRRKTNRRR